jgi:5-hydroxyisourate hydrolase-like protein (transthyretin family)
MGRMRERTLVTQRRYFGLDPLEFRAATTRVLARVVGPPPELVRVSARNLRHDFSLNAVEGEALVDGFVAEGLLEPRTERHGDYRLTIRFLEFATARVVELLPRQRANELVARASELAARGIERKTGIERESPRPRFAANRLFANRSRSTGRLS